MGAMPRAPNITGLIRLKATAPPELLIARVLSLGLAHQVIMMSTISSRRPPAGHRVQAGDRLMQDQQVGSLADGKGQHQLGPLAARQLSRLLQRVQA